MPFERMFEASDFFVMETTLSGFDAFLVGMRSTEAFLSHYRSEMDAVAMYVRKEIRTNFEVGGRPAWPPTKKPGPDGTLRRTGKLMEAASDITGSAEGSRYERTDAEDGGYLRLGVEPDFHGAAVHQYGGPTRYTVLPARPFMQLTTQDTTNIQGIFDRSVQARLQRAWSVKIPAATMKSPRR